MIEKRYSLRTWVFLFLINGLILSTGFFVLIRQSLASLEDIAQTQTGQNLRTFAHVLIPLIPESSVDPDVFVKKLARQYPGFRITVISPDGTVIGDSDAPDITKLENHGHRQEVRDALSGTEGMTVRQSTVNRGDVIYYAVPLVYNGQHMALRLSMPVDMSVYFSSSVRTTMVVSCIIIFVLVLIVSFLVSAHVVRQIGDLQKAAEQYRKGNFDFRPSVRSPRELEELGEAVEAMAQTIKTDIRNIKRKRDEFQAVFSGITEALVVFDTDMSVQEYNGIAAELFDCEKPGTDSTEARTLAQFVRNAEILKLANEAVRGIPGTAEIEAKIHGQNGIRDVLVRCTGIQSSSGTGRYLLVLTDITRLKRLEQIRTDFVANVSHELKTPVTSIKGFAETLLDGALEDPDTARHFLEIMDAQSGRLINIIEDLLTLSRLEQDSKPPETVPADLAEILRQVCRTWEKDAERKNISILFTEPAAGTDFTASVNTGLIQQAVGNIIDNAVKYCPVGSEITCMIERLPASNTAHIVIEDNGNGIPLIYRERIFERFFRVDKGRSRQNGGTGLGLSITAHIIKLHGGTVEEKDRPDKKSGARFVITLPLAAAVSAVN